MRGVGIVSMECCRSEGSGSGVGKRRSRGSSVGGVLVAETWGV